LKKNNVDDFYCFLQKQYLETAPKEKIKEYIEYLHKNIESEKSRNELESERRQIDSIEAAEEYFKSCVEDIKENEPELKMRTFCNLIESFSIHLHYIKPEYYFPYFFVDHFFKLEAIFSEFDIPLPKLPSKVKHEERLYYYIELCKSLYEYRISNNLTPIELNVFLYFFAKSLYIVPSTSSLYLSLYISLNSVTPVSIRPKIIPK